MTEDAMFEKMSGTRDELPAPARLKSRIYTALIRAQQEDGPLETVSATKRAGRALCVFEELIQIAAVRESAKSKFYCTVCHARVLAEHMEKAPIWWPHCPYAAFQKR
jgi:hypothetical protein